MIETYELSSKNVFSMVITPAAKYLHLLKFQGPNTFQMDLKDPIQRAS